MDNQTPQSSTSTSKKNILIAIVGIVLIVAVLSYLVMNRNSPKQTSLKANAPLPLPKEVTVKLTKDGFVPSTVTIESAGAVRWVNESGESNATVNSNPHPENNEHKELNLGAFNGATLVHIFPKAGTYGYHDYFHPEWKGTVIVK